MLNIEGGDILEVVSSDDLQGEPRYHAISYHNNLERYTFYTESAARFWLWLLDETARGRANRQGAR